MENRKNNAYIVSDEVLLYKLSDAGYLDRLCGVAQNRFDTSKRVWFFDKDSEILNIINKYKEENNKEKA